MKLARIVAIIMLLLQHKKVTAARLAEMFEVNVRTIYRDVETISLAGIPISTSPGAGGGISIMEEYKVAKGLFTASDITSLLIALGSSPLTNEEVSTTIAKIKGLVPEEQMRAIEFKTRQIVVDHTPWYGRRPLQHSFSQVKAALDGNRLTAFQYYDGSGRENIEPYGDCKIMVNFPFIESDYGYGMLLSFGDKCECLEPERVRREVARRAADLLNLYK